jgi:hypothetical protein
MAVVEDQLRECQYERGRLHRALEALKLEQCQEHERSTDHCAKLDRRIAKLEIALEEILNLAEGRADVDQKGDPPAMVPNAWMQAKVIAEFALK